MTFSTEWDVLYRANTHLSTWPWSDLVSYVHRYAKPSNGFNKVLELGCGAGANIPLFLSLKTDYWAIEGSPAIVDSVISRFPELAERIVTGDFTVDLPFSGPFDLIVDRISLAHNDTVAIVKTLAMIFKLLRNGGKFIGIDWFSDQHHDSQNGDRVDSHTRTNLPASSHLKGTGYVHFCNREHIIDLLENQGFRIERLEHKLSNIEIPENGQQLGCWNFVAIKP